jgi:hypothetical protein
MGSLDPRNSVYYGNHVMLKLWTRTSASMPETPATATCAQAQGQQGFAYDLIPSHALLKSHAVKRNLEEGGGG